MQATKMMANHWNVPGLAAPDKFRIESPYGGGFSVTVAGQEDELAIVVTPGRTKDPVVGLRLAWSDMYIVPILGLPTPFSWSISDGGQNCYVHGYWLTVSLKQEDDGLVIEVARAGDSDILASTRVTYEEIAYAGYPHSPAEEDVQALYEKIECDECGLPTRVDDYGLCNSCHDEAEQQ